MEGSLYEAAVAEPNLLEAWLRVGKRQVASGIDGQTAAGIGSDSEALIGDLAAELQSFRYAPLPARQVFIPKPSSPGEQRELELPALRDKVVQQAVRQVIEPVFERRFLDCSYAYRRGRGAQRAVRRVLHELHHGKAEAVARGDVDDFFDTIPHDRLLAVVSETVEDEDLVRLIGLFVTNGVLEAAGGLVEPTSGVPTGSVLAPLLSNAYLHQLDAHLRAKGIPHVRYADDWALIARSQEDVVAAAQETEAFLSTLALRLNGGRHEILRVADGFAFLGIWIRRGKLAIDRAKLKSVQAFLDDFGRRAESWPLVEQIAALAETARGWQRYYRIVDRREDLERLDELLAAFIARSATREGAAREEEITVLLEGFPWPGANPDVAEGHVQRSLEAEAARRRREVTTQKAVRRQKRRAKGLAAERSEIVVWRNGASVEASSGLLVLRGEAGEKLLERPIGRVRSLQVRGRRVRVESEALELCASRDVPVSFVSRKGSPYAIVHNPGSLRVELLTMQLEASRGPLGAEIGAALAWAKLKNQANFLKYLAKYRRKVDAAVHRALRVSAREAETEARKLRAIEWPDDGGDDWRGHVFAAEGRGAEAYWRAVGRLVTAFPGRKKPAASDPVNAALNYGYAILYGRIEGAILRAGLHSGIGFLHKPSRGRPALAYDLIEPLRAPVVDRTVLAMATRREPLELDGNSRLTPRSRKALAANILQRWWTETPYRDDHADYETVLVDQLQRLVRRLQGQGPFRPFLQRW